ncbi:MAG: hypothetical protein LBD52_01690 [Prevotellaceae bacterium]|jgi:hypothetical protein|nr:hypothetical protein [Prevotellaceae bacterium]
MASIRNIKKDIDYLIGEVISDCCTFMALYPEKKQEEALALIHETIDLRNALITRVNHPEGKAKAHYRAIFNDLLKGVDESFQKISAFTK